MADAFEVDAFANLSSGSGSETESSGEEGARTRSPASLIPVGQHALSLSASCPEVHVCVVDAMCPLCSLNTVGGGMHCSRCQVKTCNQCTSPCQADAGDGRGTRLQLLCSLCLHASLNLKAKNTKITQKRRKSMPASSFPGLEAYKVKKCPNCATEAPPQNLSKCEACKRDTCLKCTQEHRFKKMAKKFLCSSCASIMREKKNAPKTLLRRLSKSRTGSFDLFSSTIEECVEMQRSCGFTGPRYPVFIEYLIEQSIQLGAFRAEGIFRVAVKGPDILMAQKTLNSQNVGSYRLETSDPHLPAAVCKRWFRELAEPFFSDYDAIMGAADSNKDIACYQRVLDGLSQSKKDLIHRLLPYLIKFLDPVVTSATKMTSSNISIVWSQCLLRNPNDDLSLVLKAQSKEQLFMQHLIELYEAGDIK